MTQIEKNKKLKEVFEKAYCEHQKALKLRAFFKVSDKALAEDLVQVTFIKTWNYLASGGKIEMMKAFLYHILNNLIIDEYRKRKIISLESLLENNPELPAPEVESFCDFFDIKRVLEGMESLPKTYQRIVRMRYLDDLSLEEMSHATGKSKNTLAVQTHRGLQKLRSLYAR